MLRNLSQAYHYYRKAGLSPSEAMQRARQHMESQTHIAESHREYLRSRAEQKFKPWEMQELQRQHYRFFSPAAMRGFQSKVVDQVYGGNMFITSERHGGGKRSYSVRRVTKSGDIRTIGKFMGYSSKAQAERAIARIMRQTKARHSR